MDNEMYSFALKNTLAEIKNICPDILHSFLFTEEGEIIAGNGFPESEVIRVIDSIDSVMEKADSIGGVETVMTECSNGTFSLSRINDLNLVVVASKDADTKYVKTVTHVLLPTIVRLVEKINSTHSTPNNNPSFKPNPEISQNPEPEDEQDLDESKVEDNPPKTQELAPEPEDEDPDSLLPEPPVNQFIVENLGGLLIPTDTVRVDNALLTQWQELYPDRKIGEVEVETFGGKTTEAKVKPIKDSKYEGKGIVQMPEKIQSSLDIKKGELVRIKPIIQ